MSENAVLSTRSRLPSLTSALDDAIDRAIAENRIVGAVVLAAEDGRVVYERAAGYADREAERPVRIDTPFRFASVAKPFTMMTGLKLIEAGRLSPDDPVTKYLPHFHPRLADGPEAGILVSHLMSHTAGLDYGFLQPADGPYTRAGVSDGLDESRGTLADNLARIASIPLDRAPGEGWRYSVAIDVLGAVIEVITGTSLPEAIDALVSSPLGISPSFFWPEDELAAPYYDDSPQPSRMNGTLELRLPFVDGPGVRFDPHRIANRDAWSSGGGGMAGRAHDVLTLLEAYRAGDFLRKDLREAARTPRVGPEAQTSGPGWGWSWLGSILIDPELAGSPWSKGTVAWGGVYGNSWAIDFAWGRTLVALTNTAYEGMMGKFVQDLAVAASQDG